ncbi:MAG: LacI family DNA-binding transcriptional regulator [Spirochaetales bacterium]|jgi:LacI family transcriptional regulator|nr:LacI family DNA-binding transcriptional regulator [Spirochaetales bacterium]
MSIKIGDVARLAKVSVPTVSRVLNKNKYVSPELESRVLDAVKKLNYIPNDNARGLAAIKTKAVGLIVPFLNESSSSFINSCSTILEESGYDLMIGKSGRNVGTEIELLDIQLSMLVSGIILISPICSRKTISILKKQDIPVVFAYDKAPVLGFHTRIFDNKKAAFTLVSAIPDIGIRRVLILSGPADDYINYSRIGGCRQALAKTHNFKLWECDGTLEGGYKKTVEILKKEKPDVLVCLNDFMAIGALRAAHEFDIAVPGQMEVTGFEGTIYSGISSPPLTTVRFSDHLLGEESAQTIISLMEGQEAAKVKVLGFELIPEESCRLLKQGGESGNN